MIIKKKNIYRPKARIVDEDKINELFSKIIEKNTIDFLPKQYLNILNKNNQNLIHLILEDDFTLSKTLKYKLIYSLIINNVSYDLPDSNGNTPLLLACKKKLTNIVKLLLNYNVDINRKNLDGEFPLLYLILGKEKKCNPLKVKNLINQKKEIKEKNIKNLSIIITKILKNGGTPIQILNKELKKNIYSINKDSNLENVFYNTIQKIIDNFNYQIENINIDQEIGKIEKEKNKVYLKFKNNIYTTLRNNFGKTLTPLDIFNDSSKNSNSLKILDKDFNIYSVNNKTSIDIYSDINKSLTENTSSLEFQKQIKSLTINFKNTFINKISDRINNIKEYIEKLLTLNYLQYRKNDKNYVKFKRIREIVNDEVSDNIKNTFPNITFFNIFDELYNKIDNNNNQFEDYDLSIEKNKRYKFYTKSLESYITLKKQNKIDKIESSLEELNDPQLMELYKNNLLDKDPSFFNNFPYGYVTSENSSSEVDEFVEKIEWYSTDDDVKLAKNYKLLLDLNIRIDKIKGTSKNNNSHYLSELNISPSQVCARMIAKNEDNVKIAIYASGLAATMSGADIVNTDDLNDIAGKSDASIIAKTVVTSKMRNGNTISKNLNNLEGTVNFFDTNIAFECGLSTRILSSYLFALDRNINDICNICSRLDARFAGLDKNEVAFNNSLDDIICKIGVARGGQKSRGKGRVESKRSRSSRGVEVEVK